VMANIVETGMERFVSVLTFTKTGDVAIAHHMVFVGPSR